MDTQKFTLLILLSLILSLPGFAQRNCGTMEYLQQQIEQNPERAGRLQQIEEHTNQVLSQSDRSVNNIISIPVVVHVVYNVNNPVENLSEAQILSQIDILNEDFRRTNPDAPSTPALFQGVAADSEIEFCLATIDPSGNPTSGITRTPTSVSSFSTNNAVKFDGSGGHDAWPASDYMNFWICDLGGGLLGYAQFPGGPAATDGIVCDYQYVGNIGTATFPYHLGRTATHEVGHWLNLRHIWGDGGCGQDDFVSDTPLAGNPNYTGFPCTFPGPNSCNTGSNDQPDMFQNYMDYSDDGCMNIFTLGQRDRMRALFEPGGSRESLLNSSTCASLATCTDGVQNGQETGVDCGGPDCPPCPSCNDGIQNGEETGVDCGGPDCPACPTCTDGIQNGQETGVDCGGPDCLACPTCADGIQNGDEEGVDCGGANCPPCVTPCNDNSLNLTINFDFLPGQTTWEFVDASGMVVASGGPYSSDFSSQSVTEEICLPDGCYDFTIYDSGGNGLCCRFGEGNYTLSNEGSGQIIASGASFEASDTTPFCLGNVSGPTCVDGVQNGQETGVDCGGPDCPPCISCNDGIQNGDEEGIDCGGSNCPPCPPGPTCNDGIQNGQETGVDCGGPDCPPCISCNDGIQNGDEEGIDCGGSFCPPCSPTPSCSDGIQNGDEEGIDCGGSNCPPCISCNDGIQNGDEEGVDCGGSFCPPCSPTPSCSDGIQNGDEEGIDCGGSNCPPCGGGGCPYELTLKIRFDQFPEETSWQITDPGGQIVHSGGPYTEEAPSSFLEVDGLCLEAGCYTFTIFDSGGNGICCILGRGKYQLITSTGDLLASGGIFTSSESTDFCLGSQRTVPEISYPPISWEVFPVPTSDQLHIGYKLQENSSVELLITSLAGQAISRREVQGYAGANQTVVEAQDMPAGLYFVHLLHNGKRYTKRFIIIR